jgi:rhodanese-related sulfurtransferase
MHVGKVRCQICHSQDYVNCYSCHVGKDDQGLAYFQNEKEVETFKIGKAYPGSVSEENFIVVRHEPSDLEVFDHYVKDGFLNFDKVPTWKRASPHNIQRKTWRNQSCNHCHGQRDLFLSEADLLDYEKAANAPWWSMTTAACSPACSLSPSSASATGTWPSSTGPGRLGGGRLPTVEGDPPAVTAVIFKAQPDDTVLASNKELAAVLKRDDTVVIDVRSISQHMGIQKHSLAEEAGKIDGTVNLSARAFWSVEGLLKDLASLSWLLESKGITKDKTVITTCNTSQLASGATFAPKYLGYPKVKTHDGSYINWEKAQKTAQ